MANQSNMLLLAVIFFLTTSSVVLAQDLGVSVNTSASGIVQATITGRLLCTPTGNPVAGVNSTGIAGVVVTVSIPSSNGQNITLGQAVTNTGGFYEITTLNINLLISLLVNARVTVVLPLVNATCLALPTSGILQTPLTLVGVVNQIVLFAAGILGRVV